LLPGIASADAIVRSQAMKASTIAEFFIEDDHVRIELEVGLNDLPAFQKIMPDIEGQVFFTGLGTPS